MPRRTGRYDKNFRQKMLLHIKKVLSKEGYVLNSTEYINNRTKMDITCPRGHKWFASWDTIRANKRCKHCYKEGIQKKRLNKKVKPKGWEEHRLRMFERFKAELNDEGYKLRTDKYMNNRTKVPVTCPRGHDWEVSWNAWDSGKRCRTCWIEDSKKSQEEVATYLAIHGCELLSPYKGCEIPFRYRCKCGRISRIRLHDFQRGIRCSACGGEKRRITARKLRKKRLSLLN